MRNEVALCVMQILARLRPGVQRIPIDWGHPSVAGDPNIQALKRHVDDCEMKYFARYGDSTNDAVIAGRQVTFDNLIEADALLMELLHLHAVHGLQAMHDYYQYAVAHLDPLYTTVMNIVVPLFKDVTSALMALYVALPWCLYARDPAVERLRRVVDLCSTNPSSIYRMCNDNSIRLLFSEEPRLEQRIESAGVVTQDGLVRLTLPEGSDGAFLSGLFDFHKTIYWCRKQLIQKYIGEWRFRLPEYLNRMHELPIAPVLFLPEEHLSGQGEAIRESDLRQRGIPYYVIAAYPDDTQGMIVVAGLTSFRDLTPSVRLDVADTQLVNAFCYQAAFEGRTSMYGSIVDEMYLKVLEGMSFQ